MPNVQKAHRFLDMRFLGRWCFPHSMSASTGALLRDPRRPQANGEGGPERHHLMEANFGGGSDRAVQTCHGMVSRYFLLSIITYVAGDRPGDLDCLEFRNDGCVRVHETCSCGVEPLASRAATRHKNIAKAIAVPTHCRQDPSSKGLDRWSQYAHWLRHSILPVAVPTPSASCA